MVRVCCLLVAMAVVFCLSDVAFADQPERKVWEARLGIGHGSTFGTVSGAPQVNGVAGQLQFNFAPHLFLQGTVLYQIAGNVPGGAFGFVILGYQF